MVRISKKSERRAQFPRKRQAPSPKTGPKKDALEKGYKVHVNALEGELAHNAYIPKVR